MHDAQLGKAGRRSFWLFCGAFLAVHALVPYLLTGTSVFENPALRAFALTALTKFAVFRDVLSQFLVLVLVHVLFLWVILILSRPRKASARWWQQPQFAIWITGLAAWWLVLDWNNRIFVHSLWRKLFNPETYWLEATVLDALAALWLAVRVAGFLASLGSSATPLASRVKALAVALGVGGSVVLGVAFALREPVVSRPAATDATAARRPNIILIGLDSMRRDFALAPESRGMPNLAALRQQSFAEANVITPLARTYPAWVSILTGRLPRDVNARDDNVPTETVDTSYSFPKELQKAGYRTIYSTDESRFSNVDHAFGFDQIVSPRFGVADFVLGYASDLPLIHFALQVPHMEIVLPSLVGNRALAKAYFPGRYVRRLEDALGTATGQPTFVATHLCLAHWPYFAAGAAEFNETDVDALGYSVGARTLDEQLGQLLAMLERRGYLDNALVVVLADHGEGMGVDAKEPPEVVSHVPERELFFRHAGHGATLFQPKQWQIFTLFSGQTVAGPIKPGESSQVASLEDVGPAILELVGLTSPNPHRMRVVEHTRPDGLPAKTPRGSVSMETGLRFVNFDLGKPDMRRVADIAATRYEITDDARLVVRPDTLKESLRDRDFAVTDGTQTLLLRKEPDADLLIFMDDAANRWEVFPPALPPGITIKRSPLLDEACRDSQMAARMPGWCAEPAAQTPAAQLAPSDKR